MPECKNRAKYHLGHAFFVVKSRMGKFDFSGRSWVSHGSVWIQGHRHHCHHRHTIATKQQTATIRDDNNHDSGEDNSSRSSSDNSQGFSDIKEPPKPPSGPARELLLQASIEALISSRYHQARGPSRVPSRVDGGESEDSG